MSTAADRQRARRQRLANGKLLLTIETDEVKIVELLVAAKLLTPMTDHSKAEIEAAVERLLDLIAE